jgi:hypothetical protein
MNKTAIAPRLELAPSRALRPFQLARGCAKAQRPNLPVSLPITLRFAKRLKLKADGGSISHQHSHLSVQIVRQLTQRFAHYAVQASTETGQPGLAVPTALRMTLPMPAQPAPHSQRPEVAAAVVAQGRASLPPGWPLTPLRRSQPADPARAAVGNTPTNYRLKPAGAANPVSAGGLAFPPPSLPWRKSRGEGRDVPTPRRLGRLAPLAQTMDTGFPLVSWPKGRAKLGDAATSGHELSSESLRPLARLAPAKLARAKGPEPETSGWAQSVAQAPGVKPRGFSPASALPVALAWREAPAQRKAEKTRPFQAGGERFQPISDGYGNAQTAALPAETEERLSAKAREVVRQELSSQSTIERFASDVMRRLDSRLRIERERRGL